MEDQSALLRPLTMLKSATWMESDTASKGRPLDVMDSIIGQVMANKPLFALVKSKDDDGYSTDGGYNGADTYVDDTNDRDDGTEDYIDAHD